MPSFWIFTLASLEASLGGQAFFYPHIMTLIEEMMHIINFVLIWPCFQLMYIRFNILERKQVTHYGIIFILILWTHRNTSTGDIQETIQIREVTIFACKLLQVFQILKRRLYQSQNPLFLLNPGCFYIPQ